MILQLRRSLRWQGKFRAVRGQRDISGWQAFRRAPSARRGRQRSDNRSTRGTVREVSSETHMF